MTWQKLPADQVGKLRSVRVSDRIHKLIVQDHGNLAAYLRKYEQIDEQLKQISK